MARRLMSASGLPCAVLARATETAGKLAAKPAAALRLHQYRQVGERSKFFNFDTG
jgi:hypothetical protein